MARLLVITPYTKRLGIAVFDGPELVHFGVKTFRSPRTVRSVGRQMRVTLRTLMTRFSPTVIIVKSYSRHQHASRNRLPVRSIGKLSNRVGVIFLTACLETVKAQILPTGNTTMRQLFRVVAQRYPELDRFTDIQNRDQDEYYTPLLAAVAIGFAHWRCSKVETRE